MTALRRWSGGVLTLLLFVVALPAQAAVTITFWNRDSGAYFPHAFFTLRGVPDRGGPAVDGSYGFTARSVTPAILFGNVGGRVETPERKYMEGSHARFSVRLSDAQYDSIVSLIQEWGEKNGNSTYNLNKRNCIHFVREALHRVGFANVDFPKLMKKPSSFLAAVEQANPGRFTPVEEMGSVYFASLPPINGVAPVQAPVSNPGTVKGKAPTPVS